MDRYRHKFITVGLLILLVVNFYFLISQIGPFALGILRDSDKSGLWRSARFAYSGNFADYIQFLREEIPEDGTVIIPPEEVSTWALSDTPTMQFFLAPRKIINCTSIDCGADFLGKTNTFIMIMGLDRFPNASIQDQTGNIRMHNDTWGIYGPADEWAGDIETEDFRNFGVGVILPILFIGFLSLLGYYIGVLLLPKLPAWSQFGVGYGVITGLYSFGGYLILYSGWVVDLWVIFTLLTALFSAGLMIAAAKSKIELNSIKNLFTWGKELDIWVLMIMTLGLGFTFLSIGAGFHETDSIVLWGAKAVGLIADGLDGVVVWGTNTTLYPLHIPMLLALLMDTFGDLLPASKFIFPLYYFSLLLIVYDLLKMRSSKVLAGLSTLVLGTLPLISRHAMIGYANLPMTYFLGTGVILFILGSSTLDRKVKGLYWMSTGLFFAFLIWTRPEGLWLTVLIITILLAQLFIAKDNKGLSKVWIVVIPPIFITLVWYLTRRGFYVGVEPVEGTLSILVQSIFNLEFHWGDLAQIGKYYIDNMGDFQTWGVAGFSFLACLLIVFIFRVKFDRVSRILWVLSAAIFLFFLGIYYVFSFDPAYDLEWWLNTGFNRMLMPGVVLIWLGFAWMINSTATKGGAAEL